MDVELNCRSGSGSATGGTTKSQISFHHGESNHLIRPCCTAFDGALSSNSDNERVRTASCSLKDSPDILFRNWLLVFRYERIQDPLIVDCCDPRNVFQLRWADVDSNKWFCWHRSFTPLERLDIQLHVWYKICILSPLATPGDCELPRLSSLNKKV